MTAIPATPKIALLRTALPFWLSLGLLPLAIVAAVYGGWFIALLPLSTWYLFSALDYVVGKIQIIQTLTQQKISFFGTG